MGSENIRETLKYVLQANNVQLMAWGTRRIRVNGEHKRFLLLVRKTCIHKMWLQCKAGKNILPDGMKKLKRTLFANIVSALTKGYLKQCAYIYYKLHALVYENSCTIMRIIEDHVRGTKKEGTKEDVIWFHGILEVQLLHTPRRSK